MTLNHFDLWGSELSPDSFKAVTEPFELDLGPQLDELYRLVSEGMLAAVLMLGGSLLVVFAIFRLIQWIGGLV